jgi:hypothetical protein
MGTQIKFISNRCGPFKNPGDSGKGQEAQAAAGEGITTLPSQGLPRGSYGHILLMDRRRRRTLCYDEIKRPIHARPDARVPGVTGKYPRW